jgi:flagellar basal body-associated protein FliL
MLNLLEKIENLFNQIVAQLLAMLKAFFIKVLPRKFFTTVEDVKYKSAYKYARGKERSIEKSKELLEKAKEQKEKFFALLHAIQDYPVKDKLLAFVEKLKIFFFKTSPKQHIKNFWALVLGIKEKIGNFFKRFSPAQVALTLTTVAVIGMGVNSIYQGSSFIWHSEKTSRAPASIETFKERPEYYKRTDKIMVVRNVRIPVFVENVKQIKSVTIEFSVRTSTRFAKIYLEEYEHKLRDHFFMTMEPILSSFPIENEGKNVIKDKIQEELNIFLESENVEGQVEAVQILFIIAT